MNRLLKIGGEQLDSAIANLVRHSKDFIIGRPTAERLRKEFGVFDQSTGSFSYCIRQRYDARRSVAH